MRCALSCCDICRFPLAQRSSNNAESSSHEATGAVCGIKYGDVGRGPSGKKSKSLIVDLIPLSQQGGVRCSETVRMLLIC